MYKGDVLLNAANPFDMLYDLEIDATGLLCPLPLLRLKKGLQSLEVGQVLRIEATDPASTLDFGVFLEQSGHQLLEQTEVAAILCYVIRKR